MKNSVNEQLEKAGNGLFIWQGLCNKLSIGPNDKILLIPNNSKEFSYFSLLYSRSMIQKSAENFYLLTTDKVVWESTEYWDIPFRSVSLITKDDLEVILALYNLYMFTDRLIILSPHLPVGRTGYHLVENGMLNIEEYISLGLLRSKVFQREPLVTYDGYDEDLRDFFTVQREGE